MIKAEPLTRDQLRSSLTRLLGREPNAAELELSETICNHYRLEWTDVYSAMTSAAAVARAAAVNEPIQLRPGIR